MIVNFYHVVASASRSGTLPLPPVRVPPAQQPFVGAADDGGVDVGVLHEPEECELLLAEGDLRSKK